MILNSNNNQSEDVPTLKLLFGERQGITGIGAERTGLVQSYQRSRGYQLQFVLSLNYLSDLLFALIQSCSEQNEAVKRQDRAQPTGKRFKASELVQSAQKMARYGSIKEWRRIRYLQELIVCFVRNCASRICLSVPRR